MTSTLQLRCSDLAHHADLFPRAGIDEDAFRHHSHDALDPDDEQDRCFCYEAGGDPDAWDAENRREANRRCNAPVTVARPGFELVVCCRCFDRAGADDDKLAEVGRRVAAVERERLDRAAERERQAEQSDSPEESLCFALARSIDLVTAGHSIEEVNRAGRALRGGTTP